MSSRRLEKVSKVIRGTVSEVIQNHLSDPRVRGLISVTRVDASPDLRSARVYLSILGVPDKQQELSLEGIQNASGYIRTRLARHLTMKTCPALTFCLDDSLKESIETTVIIQQVSEERRRRALLCQTLGSAGESEGEEGSEHA